MDRDGKTYIDGKHLSGPQFVEGLRKLGGLSNPEPAVLLETEAGSPCNVIEQVRSQMEEAIDCANEGHCDEGIRSVWSELPYTGTVVP